MSPKDKFIILIAVLAMVLAYSGAGLLIPTIKAESHELQLTANDDAIETMPPDIAILYTSLASFRGIFVDILWGRATQMKQDGKHYEANKLAELITKLQPRFGKVWAFHAWNMAYNISVTTHTPEERWMWVQDGIKLLRDEGIPLNPNNVLLYKELGWIYLHKVGQFSDEMHWYYKEQLAHQWHEVLGTPPHGMAPKLDNDGKPVLDEAGQPVMEYAAIAEMRRIARSYESYVNKRSPTRQMVKMVGELSDDAELVAGDEVLHADLRMLPGMSLSRMLVKLQTIREKLVEDARAEQARKLDPLIALIESAIRAGRTAPMARFVDANPNVVPLLNELTAAGLKIDAEFLKRVNLFTAMRESGDTEALGIKLKMDAEGSNQAILDLLDDTERVGLRQELLDFTKAMVIYDDRKMDPLWMLELMEGYWFVKEGEAPTPIPVDWRHAGAHGIYWASLGVRKAKGLLRPEDFDVLNTDRQLLHGLQALLHNGRVLYDPISGYYRTMVDPRYIDAYDQAVFGAMERIIGAKEEGRMDVGVAPQSFQAGHENFLIWAVQALYFYGDEAKAERYLSRARKLYGAREAHSRQRYAKTLKDFVMFETVRSEALEDPDAARTAVNGYILRAFEQGFAMGDNESAERMLKMAQQIHTYYNRTHAGSSQDFQGVRKRMDLTPFNDMLAQAFVAYMLRPIPSADATLAKSRVWKNTPDLLKLRTYDFIKPRLFPQVQRMNIRPALAFPEPPGMDAYRKRMAEMSEQQKAVAEDRPFESGYERK